MCESKQLLFNDYYKKPISQLKWFEPFVDPIILDEYNNQIITEGMNLLDVGAGCSFDSIFFATKGLHVTAVDFAENALEKLKKLSELFGVNISAYNCSVLTLPDIFINQFDIVSDNGCFHHIAPSERFLYAESIARVLKSGGRLYIRAHSAFGAKPSHDALRAYRLTSDEIISTFYSQFEFEALFTYNYVRTQSGLNRVWFIKLLKR